MRAPTALLQACLFAPVLFLTGCPVWDGDDDGAIPCVGVGCECSSGRDCSTGYCDPAGFCDFAPADAGVDTTPVDAGPMTCRTNGDCPVGEYCGEGETCEPSSTCTRDSECGQFICDFRDTCVPTVPGACRDDGDCGGLRCIEGFCREEDRLCQFALDCPGQACVNGACTGLCATVSDCGSGSTCDGGFCRPIVECASTSECGSGENCVDGRCLPDCRDRDVCGSTDYCAQDSFCRPDWRGEAFCTRDEQCTGESVCRDSACRTPCPSGTDAECRDTDPGLSCGPMNLCISSTPPECALSADCGDGQECVDAECRRI